MRTDRNEALALVHEGWRHLRLQRPLAAWASWQRALRVDPEDRAAREALDRLSSAEELPAAARVIYRFRTPRGDNHRALWDVRLRGQGLEDLDAAAAAFAALAAADPTDAAAHYNVALCLAWRGRNAEAVAALDRVVSLEAADHGDDAVDAWTLAEILRHGAGAEALADDFSHSLTITWSAEDADPTALAASGLIRQVPSPLDPAAGLPDARVYEWIDRPMPEPSASLTADDLPRVLASVVQTAGTLRLSTANPSGRHEDAFTRALGDRGLPSRWEATPLPLGLLDAALWTFRFPPGLDEQARQRLAREAVEAYFEAEWIHLGRLGLGPHPGAPVGVVSTCSPLEAGRRAAEGDAGTRVRLEAVIRVREQLGVRPRAALLYAGYPFDRLRRRVGLEPNDPTTFDPADVSCMGSVELGRLDPAALDPHTLADSYRSALALLDDTVVARMAAAMAQRHPPEARP
jgi:tetratricopeptide (TPR) repeat protein